MKKNLKHNEVASRGGRATLSKYGKEYFKKLGARSAKIRMKRFGTDYYKHLSELGVSARKEKAAGEKNKLIGKIKDKINDIIKPSKDGE